MMVDVNPNNEWVTFRIKKKEQPITVWVCFRLGLQKPYQSEQVPG